MKYFTTTYRVIYGDVDAMKVAYYGNYLRWFEIGRTELIRHLGLPYAEIEARGYFLPVSEAYCKYSRSARYDEILLIATGLGFIRRASMRFDYRITDQENGLIAQGFTVHACLDKDGRMVRLPESIVHLLENWR
ncbi:MAG TPA: thioesterase family protein [Thermodesulfobacteriota bacterium]|nr:thioesterase family protein [Thermodesulfobacteriota bacterium]